MPRQVTAFSNPTVKRLRSLREKKARRAEGLFLAEGLRILTEAREWQADLILLGAQGSSGASWGRVAIGKVAERVLRQAVVPVLILVLFLSTLLHLEAGWLVVTIFCASQLSLIGSMLAFIRDMNLALAAVRLEIRA